LDDRAEDLFKLVKIETTEGKKALRKSLEEFGATDGNGKFWLRDVEKLQAEGYRYSSFEPSAGWSSYSGNFPEGEWYCTFDKFTAPNIANDSLLMPGNTAIPRYRFEFKTTSVKDRVRIARGQGDTSDFIEPITKDIPIGPDAHISAGTGQSGGSSQFIVEGEILTEGVWDMVTGLKVWPVE
jgi:hypothetical protein